MQAASPKFLFTCRRVAMVILGVFFAIFGLDSQAKVIEETIAVPVPVTDMYGKVHAHDSKTVRIPTLWVYSENGLYMGSQYPKEWFAAFKENGGRGEFLVLPANGKDGHSIFTQNPNAWRPQVLEVLRAHGLVK